ncbi:ATP-binding protein [Halobacteriaceae archaeon GCM10025711]
MSSLPVPVENSRKYIRIRPTDTPVNPQTVEREFRRFHQLEKHNNNTQDSSGKNWLGRLFQSTQTTRPTLEFLVVSQRDGERIDYYVGVDDSLLASVERGLRALYPDSYEFERVERTPEQLGLPANLDDTKNESETRTDSHTTESSTRGVAGVEFVGVPDRRLDWQTRLTPFGTADEDNDGAENSVPLSMLVEAMAEHSTRVVFQVLLRPMPDWSGGAEDRRISIELNEDTYSGILSNYLTGMPDREDIEERLTNTDRRRLEELDAKDARHSFEVNARAIAITDTPGDSTNTTAVEPNTASNPEGVVRELASAFSSVSHTTYSIESRVATGGEAVSLQSSIRGREFRESAQNGFTSKLPWSSNASPIIVADPLEAPNFCVLDGTRLSGSARRAIAPTPGERTAIPRPPFELLDTYRGEGMPLGMPLTQDGTPDDQPLVLPPDLQPLHLAIFGKTGSGKTTTDINAMLANYAATDGADILIDRKGDGMPIEYLRAHYATHGSLENVIYFECASTLPAFSFFDIRDELAAGVPRTTAVEDTVDHYIEILTQIMGADRFGQAVRSPDIIRYLTKALFDPVHGSDAFSHRDLHQATRRMHDRQSAPSVSDADLERMLNGVVANRARSFDEIMQGVANRMEKIPVDKRLARVFNHTPTGDDPVFDLADYLDEDVVIIFDMGDLRREAQRVLTLVILSNLWTALRRRARRNSGDNPLVNLYVEEAASIAVTDLLKELLAQARGFDLSVLLSMQFPGQLRSIDEAAYDEVLNNISTFVTGNVPVDRKLTRRLATDDMPPQDVGNRLRALRRGQWFLSLPAGFNQPEPRPFLLQSLTPPPGDPAGNNPLTSTQTEAFHTELEDVRARTRNEAGLTIDAPSTTTEADNETPAANSHSSPDESAQAPGMRVDTALPYTSRMPATVEYDASIHALRCTNCDTRYDPHTEGMQRAITCCSSLEDVDTDDIPITDINLKLTPKEIADSEYTTRQLLFLQAVYNAQQLRYDPLEYDLLRDSMLRLQEYTGIDTEDIDPLLDADLLRHDTDHPHRLYTVSPDGRKIIGESYRQGVDYGHGAGDLEESSEHVLAVEIGRRYLQREYAQNPDSPVTTIHPYYEIREGSLPAAGFMGDSDDAASAAEDYTHHRLDCVGLDDDGEIIVTLEAERPNNDIQRAVPEDYDKMAACNPEEAIWVVMTQAAGHRVLSALNDPIDGETRVEKTYAQTTPPQQFRIDTPGLTAMYPAEWLRDNYLDGE